MLENHFYCLSMLFVQIARVHHFQSLISFGNNGIQDVMDILKLLNAYYSGNKLFLVCPQIKNKEIHVEYLKPFFFRSYLQAWPFEASDRSFSAPCILKSL